MNYKVRLTAAIARGATWVLVFGWCLMIVGVGLVMMLSNARANAAPPPPGVGDLGGPIGGPSAGLLGSVILMVLFMIGLWCAVGVIIGFGVDRAITRFEEIFLVARSASPSVSATASNPTGPALPSKQPDAVGDAGVRAAAGASA